MIDVLLVIAVVCAAILGLMLVATIAVLIWAVLYTIYCVVKGKNHPFEHQNLFNSDEECK